MNVTDKTKFEASFILPEHCTLVLTEQVAPLFRYVDLNALRTAAAAEDELPIGPASTPPYGRMPASVMAGDHGFESTARVFK
jgi:hypothetical protein